MKKGLMTDSWSVLFIGTLFILFFLVFKPVLNSDDDFYFLYTLAGGHNAAPTPLLHYLYTLHPIITWPLSELFK
jgi:hypothetical protein